MSEDRKRSLATHLSISNKEFLTDLREGVSGVSDPAVNLCSMMVVMVGGRPQQDCLTSVQGRPVQHVNSSIDRCPIRTSGCDQSCMLMSCSRRQTEDQLRTNILRSITSTHQLTKTLLYILKSERLNV